MKVFVLTLVEVNECCGETVDVIGVYSDKKEAMAELAIRAEKFKKDLEDWWNPENPAFEEYTDDPDHFCVWEDGYYNNNHINMMITEKEVDGGDETQYDMDGNPVHINDKVIWYDPDVEARDLERIYTVYDVHGEIVRISDDYSEAEVFSEELKIVK